jgi:predicted TIM-barrel fold metal-dependent hydrolase
MMIHPIKALQVVFLLVSLALTAVAAADSDLSGADHHFHIRSASASAVWAAMCAAMPEACDPDFSGPPAPTGASDVIAALDAAGLAKGVVLSLGYFYGFPELQGSEFDGAAQVRAENQYVADQVARFPDRLVGFFSVNPLAPFALEEIRYWADAGGLLGLKLQMANSDFRFDDPQHRERLNQVLALLQERELPLVVHLRNRNPQFGAADANAFIDAMTSSAPGITLHVAHLAGWGGYDAATDAALGAFVQALEDGRLSRSRVYFDLSAVVLEAVPDEPLRQMESRLRQIGFEQLLFASDYDAAEAPSAYLHTIKSRLRLTEAEWQTLLGNQAPYLR